jgi:hypothetical protein
MGWAWDCRQRNGSHADVGTTTGPQPQPKPNARPNKVDVTKVMGPTPITLSQMHPRIMCPTVT